MSDKKSLIQNQALQGTQLELASANINYAAELKDEDVERKAHIQAARLIHNEQETNLGAVDAKFMNNKQGTRAQVTSVDMKAKNNKTEISLTQLSVKKDAKDDAKVILTAANITKDAEGNTTKVAMTNAGAGQSFNIPIKGNKDIGGVTVKHEFTVIKEEQGEQKLFPIFSIFTYNSTVRAEKWEALKN